MTSEPTWKWVDWISKRSIVHAARAVPTALAARLEEEWLATAAELPNPLSRLRFAAGCWYAVPLIAREHAEPELLAAAPTHRRFVRLPKDEFPLLTVSGGTFILIISLNAALLYGLAAGLGPQFIKRIAGPQQPAAIFQVQDSAREVPH